METASNPTASQNEACAPAAPQKEHAWLQKLVGNWTAESDCATEPGQPPQKNRGTEVVKPLGDLWIVGNGEGEMPGGGTAKMMLTLGFDPKKNRFVGTWVGSMMAYMWVYEGELDDSGRVLTLNSEGPSFTAPGKTAKYQDIIEFKDADYRTLSSRCLGEDGKWSPMIMTVHYRRTA